MACHGCSSRSCFLFRDQFFRVLDDLRLGQHYPPLPIRSSVGIRGKADIARTTHFGSD
jgi:hypothetical protein